ncbi:MAG: trigger factor [Prevotellaceae bacterium]|jgi:trigger factor|nr:trigger factor [Prevotellaceae bacterium]
MNIVQTNIDAVNATLTVQVSKSDYEEKVENALRNYRKKANIPGFRPGMVPASLVKKMYGKAMLAEEINHLVSDKLYEYIKENKLNMLGEPLPSESQPEINFESQEEFEFVFDLGLAPEFELNLDKKTKVKYYNIELTDDMVDNQVKSYTGRFGQYVQENTVEERDVVKGNLVELTAKGKEKEDGIKVEAAVLCPAYIKVDDIKNLFVGKTIGDVVKFNPKTAFENENEIASLLKINKEEAAEINADFQFTITGVTRYKEAEINQELFDKAFGEGVVKSEEEFRAKIRENIQETLTADSDYKFGIDVRAALLKKVDGLVFPDATLKRWLQAKNQHLPAESVEADYPKMIEDLKWQLISDKIGKANNLKVEFADIENYAKKIARAQFAQYGMPNVPDEMLANYTNDMLKDEKSMRNMMSAAYNEKVIESIKTTIKLDETAIEIEKFNEMLKD